MSEWWLRFLAGAAVALLNMAVGWRIGARRARAEIEALKADRHHWRRAYQDTVYRLGVLRRQLTKRKGEQG